MEPVEEHRRQAEKALAPFSTSLAESVPYLGSLKGDDFDLILANHSIYYLTAPDVLDLANRIAAEGMFVVALQSTQSALAKIWLESCKLSGEAFPFLLSDDVERLFEENAIAYERRDGSITGSSSPDTEGKPLSRASFSVRHLSRPDSERTRPCVLRSARA